MKTWPAVLAAAAFVWPLLLLAGLAERIVDGPGWLAGAVYTVAGRVCHQDPARSFATADVVWPVCGRCAGLYAAAPLGAVWAMRRPQRDVRRRRLMLAVALVPGLVTWGVEAMAPLAIGTTIRALTALPLGAAIACLLVDAAGRQETIG